MFQACRPMGRLFYWVLVVAAITPIAFGGVSEESSAGKPATSLTAKPGAAKALPRAAALALQSGASLTSVVDTVYMADGSAAQGILVITWGQCEFSGTTDGHG